MRNSLLTLTDKGGLNADAILGDNAAATVQRYYDAQRQKRAGMHVSPLPVRFLLSLVPSTRCLRLHSTLPLQGARLGSQTAAISSLAALCRGSARVAILPPGPGAGDPAVPGGDWQLALWHAPVPAPPPSLPPTLPC